MGNRGNLGRRDFLKIAGTASLLGPGAAAAVPVFVLVQDGRSSHAIFVPNGAAAPVAFAAAELQRYLEQMSGAKLPVKTSPAGEPTTLQICRDPGMMPRTTIAPDEDSDAFQLKVNTVGVVLAGASPRGTLYAAYALLERLGCRFYEPGPDGEIVPRSTDLLLSALDQREQPAIRYRGFDHDTSAVDLNSPQWVQDLYKVDGAMVDWAGKNRINNLGLRPQSREANSAAIAQRGLVQVQGGGHNVPRILTPEMFREHPDYFREDGGERRPDGNVCISNPAAVNLVVEAVVKQVKDDPGLKLIGIQGSDVWGGSWCDCRECRDLNPVEQNLTLLNRLVQRLDEEGINRTRVIMPAYRDTHWCRAEKVQPDARLVARVSSRERCYGHSIDDPTCGRNQWYATNVRRWVKLVGPGRVGPTEYHTDSMMFESNCPLMVRTIHRDMRFYNSIGCTLWLREFWMGAWTWWAYGLNFLAVARFSWNPNLDVEDLLDDYFRNYFPKSAAPMQQFYDRFEGAQHLIQTFGDYENLPQTFDPIVEQLLDNFKQGRKQLAACEAPLADALRLAQADEVERRRVERYQNMWRFASKIAAAWEAHALGNYWFAIVRHGEERREVFHTDYAVKGYGKAERYLQAAKRLWTEAAEYGRQVDPHRSAWTNSVRGGLFGNMRVSVALADAKLAHLAKREGWRKA